MTNMMTNILTLQSMRIGPATNSSSSHSVVMHSSRKKAEKVNPISSNDDYYYGWEMFTLKKAEEKLRYAVVANKESLKEISSHEMMVIEKIAAAAGVKKTISEMMREDIEIDHQSFFQASLPSGLDFASWFSVIMSPEVIIYGGNDNERDNMMAIHHDAGAMDLGNVIRWKKDGDAVIGYNPKNGGKARWAPTPYTKSSVPELVDVKITDYCGYGCSFCYQGSTKKGQHAPFERIVDIFDKLSDLGVFEVAIGGGEPCTHPRFSDIAKAAADRKIGFNFTAYGLDWLHNKRLVETMKRSEVFGVGISVHKSQDILKISRARTAMMDAGAWNVQIIAQTVVGAASMNTIEKTVDEAIDKDVPIILLGYKTTGRGGSFKRPDVEKERLLNILEKVRARLDNEKLDPARMYLSVDTAFLDLHGDVLDRAGIDTVLRASPEGKFSCYIDAVTNTIGASSYGEEGSMQPLEDIKSQFAAY